MKITFTTRLSMLTASVVMAMAAVTSTGCQITEGGQTLPSPWYMYDDIQYFAPGAEFKLSKEAAAQKAYRADEAARRSTP